MKRILSLLFLASALDGQAQANLTSSLQACYSLDGNANDPVNNFTGTLSVVTPTLNRFNSANSAYYFNGSTSSYIKLPNNSLLKPNEITFSAWVKADVLNGVMDIVFTKNSFSSYFSAYSMAVVNSGPNYKFSLYRQDGSGDNFITSTTSVSVNTWYHIAFSMNSTIMKLYVNGVLEASVVPTITSFNYDPTRYVILGGTNETYNDPWHGTIDNARFYNRILNATEVSQLYSTDPSCLPVPLTSFSVFPSTVCAGGAVALSDLSSNNPNAWNWQIPGGTPSSPTGSNATVAFQNPGTYIVSMTSSNTVGAGNTATQSIIVLPNPTVTILSNGIACAGQNNTLSVSGASSYTWSTNQTGSSIVVSPTGNSTYTVIGTGANGCVSSANISVTVVPAPVLNISGSSTVCQGLSTTLLVNGTAITYTWSNGTTGNLVTVTPNASIVYTVTGTAVNGCTNNATQLVFVNTLPAVIINVNNTSVCSGDPVVLSGAGAASYSWTGGILNNVTFYPSTTSNYSVTGTGANGCKNTASVQIIVNPLPILTHSSNPSFPVCSGEPVILTAGGANIYNWSTGGATPMITVTPTSITNYTVTGTDANGCKDVFVFTLKVNDCLGLKNNGIENDIKVYPNPTHGKFTIEISTTEIKNYEVVDLLGSLILKGKLDTSDKNIIDLNNYPDGIYFLKVRNEEFSKTIKIVKE